MTTPAAWPAEAAERVMDVQVAFMEAMADGVMDPHEAAGIEHGLVGTQQYLGDVHQHIDEVCGAIRFGRPVKFHERKRRARRRQRTTRRHA